MSSPPYRSSIWTILESDRGAMAQITKARSNDKKMGSIREPSGHAQMH
jgi:hypothetical protein